MKSTILTGDRPTGPLHLGHFVGSLKNRVKLQEEFNQFVVIADVQALTDNFDDTTLIEENIYEVLLDQLAVGIDPKKTTFFLQSSVPELFELSTYFMNLVTVSRLERNPTIKEEIYQKDFGRSIPAGFLTYPVYQAADILAFKADLVPVGEDQSPMIEQANEIGRKFNRLYRSPLFKEILPLIGQVGRLPGIDGKTKMGKTAGNAIFLSDTADQIKRKVNLMYTDPNHLRVADPGKVEGNVVFDFLDIFDGNKEELIRLKDQYRQGGIADSKIKERLTVILEDIICPIRNRRAEIATDRGYLLEILRAGSNKARTVVADTLSEVKAAMGLIDFTKLELKKRAIQ